jgi:hypothetical protein
MTLFFHTGFRKIDGSIPIVAETEQIADRRNSPLNSRSQISDGSGARCSAAHGKICAEKSVRYHDLKSSSGSEGAGIPWRALE